MYCHGQTVLDNQQEGRRKEIEKQIAKDQDKLIVLVRVKGQKDLQKVLNKNWPENIETTFNILKNQKGQVIYIGESPTSESGDWNLELKHYFADNGQLIAFEKRLSYFNEECTEGAVVENIIELYDNSFNLIKTSKKITDIHGNELPACENAYDWTFEKRGTLPEFAMLKGIQL